jgi:hypothetical protein
MRKYLLFITSLLFSSQLFAARASHCVHLKQEQNIHQCLNDFGKAYLASDSVSGQMFTEEMTREAHLYGLEPAFMMKNPLDEYFRMYVDKKSKLKGYEGNKCFNFSKNDSVRRQQIFRIQYQIIEVAKFLANYHAKSLGRQVSLLFPIKEVSFCGMKENGDRPMAFRRRRLHFGVDINKDEYYAADTLMEIWNTGNPIRVSDVNVNYPFRSKARTVYHGVRGDMDAILRDKIAEKWHLLNPIGSVRRTAVGVLLEVVSKKTNIADAIEDQSTLEKDEFAAKAYSKLVRTVSGPGFEQIHLDFIRSLSDEEQITDLYMKWQRKMNDIKTVASYLETGMMDKSQGSDIVVMAREQTSLLASYANNHEISVKISQMISAGTPLGRFEHKSPEQIDAQQETIEIHRDGWFTDTKTTLTVNPGSDVHLNLDDTSGLLFAGNTSDIVDVELTLPKIEFGTYKRVSLYELLEEELN